MMIFKFFWGEENLYLFLYKSQYHFRYNIASNFLSKDWFDRHSVNFSSLKNILNHNLRRILKTYTNIFNLFEMSLLL